MVTERLAANASAMSSGANCRSARAYTTSALLDSASVNIMLARSTACRHGVGLTAANATSISNTLPSRSSRFEGLMSRWAMPASQRRLTIARASSISPTPIAGGISTAPSKNSMTTTYSRSGVISAKPTGAGDGKLASRMRRSMWSSYSARRRTVENGFSSSSRPYTIVRVNLYHRSDRRWLSA